MKSVQNWDEAKFLVKDGITDIKRDGKNTHGEAYEYKFDAGFLPANATKGIWEFFDKLKNGENPWKTNSQNTPIHVLGSFNLSIRVNANGTTATVCIYDAKTVKSFSDGNAGKNSNRSRKDYYILPLTTTYQRYLWNIKL